MSRTYINTIVTAGVQVEQGLNALQTVEAITAEIQRCKSLEGETTLWIGRCLIEAKRRVPHGKWLPWLRDNAGFSERAAARLMQLAREWKDPALLSELGTSKAVAILALPARERAGFLNGSHIVGSEEKRAVDMTYRELKKAVRAWLTSPDRVKIRNHDAFDSVCRFQAEGRKT